MNLVIVNLFYLKNYWILGGFMNLLIVSTILLLAFISVGLSKKAGIPAIILFIILGMGSSYLGIGFHDLDIVYNLASYSLILLSFYGGFAIKWKDVKSSAKEGLLLSTLGVLITTFIIGLFLFFMFDFTLFEGILIGSILGSTDAAGIFSILRSRKLSMKYQTNDIIQIESGANDAVAKSLTMAFIATMAIDTHRIPIITLRLIVIGVVIGFLVSAAYSFVIKRLRVSSANLLFVFILTGVLISYSLADTLGGNGYISVYILGLSLGNIEFHGKRSAASFVEGISGIVQIGLFYLLGGTSSVKDIIAHLPIAIALIIFITLVARPLAVYPILKLMGKPINQIKLISFAGFRGSSAIYLALKTMNSELAFEVIDIVFGVIVLSFIIQTIGLPRLVNRLNMNDENKSVIHSFNDYKYNTEIGFLNIKLLPDSSWIGQPIKELNRQLNYNIAEVIREGEIIIPHGATRLEKDDSLVLAGKLYDNKKSKLSEIKIEKGHSWINKKIKNIPFRSKELLVVLIRGDDILVPKGETIIQEKDLLITNEEHIKNK